MGFSLTNDCILSCKVNLSKFVNLISISSHPHNDGRQEIFNVFRRSMKPMNTYKFQMILRLLYNSAAATAHTAAASHGIAQPAHSTAAAALQNNSAAGPPPASHPRASGQKIPLVSIHSESIHSHHPAAARMLGLYLVSSSSHSLDSLRS